MITYTKAHMNNTSLSACLNCEADHYAYLVQSFASFIPIAPTPTFFMDPYTFYHEPDGWIKSNIPYYFDHFAAKATADKLALMPKHQMSAWLYDPNLPPPWIYTKAPSAYTALVHSPTLCMFWPISNCRWNVPKESTYVSHMPIWMP
jgi:hypothetical protein